MDSEEEKNIREQVVAKMLEKNGLTPIDLSQTERRIGNTQRSDFEEAEQIRDALEKKDKMDSMMSADSIEEVALITADLAKKKEKNDPVRDYIDSRTPRQDYTDKFEEEPMIEDNNKTDNAREFDDNKLDITKTEETESTADSFDDNKLDMDLDKEPETGTKETFDENKLDIAGEKQMEKEFSENAGDITGEDSSEEDTDRPGPDYRP